MLACTREELELVGVVAAAEDTLQHAYINAEAVVSDQVDQESVQKK